MPNYEHVFICRQDLTSVEAETLAEDFKGTLTENGGKVIESEYWGLRSIAYRMNKNRKGHYLMFKSNSDTKAVAEICLLYTSPSPRDREKSRMPSSA